MWLNKPSTVKVDGQSGQLDLRTCDYSGKRIHMYSELCRFMIQYARLPSEPADNTVCRAYLHL